VFLKFTKLKNSTYFTHSGAVHFDELLKSSSESDIAEIEKLQTSISPDSVSHIQFSSGTTGQPKAAELSHYGLVNNSYFAGVRHELDKNYRRILLNNPLFHVYGTTIGIMNSMTHGSTLVLPAPHFSPEDSLKTIAKEKCDVIFGTPTSE
jgi:medium-chain acyl-CoA ligase, mitochondrial